MKGNNELPGRARRDLNAEQPSLRVVGLGCVVKRTQKNLNHNKNFMMITLRRTAYANGTID